jgi:hypothetical protein
MAVHQRANVIQRESPPDFSLVVGGPVYDFCVRAHLEAPDVALTYRRLLAAVALTWAPLWLLAAIDRHLDRQGAVAAILSLLHDVDVQARLLIALPLLIAAEPFVHQRLTAVVRQFLIRDLVPSDSVARFFALMRSSRRLVRSAGLDIVAVVLTLVGGHYLRNQQASLHLGTWFGRSAGDGVLHLTSAGWWFMFVSLPVFRFLLVRWYVRIIVVWYRFMWSVARLRLRLNVLHPDRAGGLGFITTSALAFVPVLLAQTVLLAAFIAQRTWHDGATVLDFEREIVAALVLLLMLVLLPHTFFAGQLERTWRTGLGDYGLLATRYVDRFRRKWLGSDAAPAAPLLGTGDLQSLADLGTAYGVARDMRLVPVSRSVVVRLTVIIVLPLLPLSLTIVPFHEIVSHMLRLIV